MGHLAKAIAHAKAIRNGQFGSKLKMQKTCQKSFYNYIRVVLSKKPLEKASNIGEMR